MVDSSELRSPINRPAAGIDLAIAVLLRVPVRGQIYVEDCQVCCHPIEVRYTVEDDAVCDFEARAAE